MRGADLTEHQLSTAEKFITLVRPEGRKTNQVPDAWLAIKWCDLVRLVAHYGAIRAQAVARGGSVDVPEEAKIV
jgi:hypothetical protein